MQTVLGSGGQIAEELARELHRNFTQDIRLVSRHPRKVNDTDQLVSADLMDPEATDRAVQGSEIVYLTVGLPMDSALWEAKFPTMMANTIAACRKHGSKLVFFDNTYMYPRTSTPQTEDTGFAPLGRKATVRARIATMLLDAMRAGTVDAVICRAPEFYGPGKTQSLTNSAVFDRIARGKRALVPLNADAKRSLIWTPDASRARSIWADVASAGRPGTYELSGNDRHGIGVHRARDGVHDGAPMGVPPGWPRQPRRTGGGGTAASLPAGEHLRLVEVRRQVPGLPGDELPRRRRQPVTVRRRDTTRRKVATRSRHSWMGRPYVFSMLGKHEAGPASFSPGDDVGAVTRCCSVMASMRVLAAPPRPECALVHPGQAPDAQTRPMG
jgi:nucleoside-diphosphate-sugar epimerase